MARRQFTFGHWVKLAGPWLEVGMVIARKSSGNVYLVRIRHTRGQCEYRDVPGSSLRRISIAKAKALEPAKVAGPPV